MENEEETKVAPSVPLYCLNIVRAYCAFLGDTLSIFSLVLREVDQTHVKLHRQERDRKEVRQLNGTVNLVNFQNKTSCGDSELGKRTETRLKQTNNKMI